MCEQLGVEPDPERLPSSLAAFPEEVQLAFTIFGYLPDRWDSMSGGYFGKDWSSANFFLDLFNVEDKRLVVLFVSKMEGYYTKKVNQKVENKRKADERKATAGGKQYVHNVKG
jgi:hypothetical protein